MTVILTTAAHLSEIRCAQAGDWRDGRGIAVILGVDLGNEQMNQVLQTHEYHEWMWCRAHGITDEEVTKWDAEHPGAEEPGEMPGCPYFEAHAYANKVEREAAAALGVDWRKYEAAIEKALCQPKP